MQSHDTTPDELTGEVAEFLFGTYGNSFLETRDAYVKTAEELLATVRAALTPPVEPLEPGERVIIPADPDDERASWVALVAGEDYLIVQAQAFLNKDEVQQLRDACDRFLAAQSGEKSVKTNGTM